MLSGSPYTIRQHIMNTTHSTKYRRGLYCVIGCYLIWGFFPLYWLPLVGQPISAGQLMAHRIVWASLLAIGTVACSPSARNKLAQAVKSRQTLTAFAICKAAAAFARISSSFCTAAA